MNRPTLGKPALAVLCFCAAAAGLVLLHRDNLRLQREVAKLASKSPDRERAQLQEDRVRLEAVAAASTQGAGAVHEQLQAALAEAAALAKQAEDRRTQKEAKAARNAYLLANNHDPTVGPVRLENVENRGRATPTDALQTIIWAALKGDDAELAKSITMLPLTRTQAEEYLARLPVEARASWTPEKLVTLWATYVMNDVSALQITGETMTSVEAATVTFSTPETGENEHINFKFTPDGWKAYVPGDAVARLLRKLPAAPPGK